MTQVDGSDEASEGWSSADNESQHDDSRVDDPMEVDSMGSSSSDGPTFAESRKRKSSFSSDTEVGHSLLKRRCVDDDWQLRAVSPFCLDGVEDAASEPFSPSTKSTVSSSSFWPKEPPEVCYVEKLDSIEETGTISICKDIICFDMIIVKPFNTRTRITELFESLQDICETSNILDVYEMIKNINQNENEIKFRIGFTGSKRQQALDNFQDKLKEFKSLFSDKDQDSMNGKEQRSDLSYSP